MTADAMHDEFDTVAGWTADAVTALGEEYALPAGCRGSGSPSGLTWLCEALDLQQGTTLADIGAGVGGPAAFAAERYGAAPVLVEPMLEACGAAQRLFSLPTVQAWSQALPLQAKSFTAAWALGVLCTTEDKLGLLREARRVLVPQGRLGLLVLVRTGESLSEHPEGNSFPTEQEVHELLERSGFLLVEQTDDTQLPPTPVTWTARVDRVEEQMRRAHGDEDAWRRAEAQSELLGRLLGRGELRTVLIHATAAG